MLRWIWRRRRLDNDTRAEIESHIELLTDRYVRSGMSQDDARAAAARQFGNAAWHREEIHVMNGIQWMDELWQDVRYALRSIRRRPTLAAGVIITLALGIGANTAVFSVVDATLLRPLPYPHADRVVYIRNHSLDDNRISDATAEEVERWAPLAKSLERVEARTFTSVLLTGPEGAARVFMLQATPGYFGAVGSRPIAGRALNADDARPGATPVVVLSERLWRARYGARTDIVGRTIDLDSAARVVVGVMTDVQSDTPGFRFSIYEPLVASGTTGEKTAVRGVAWLRPGVTIEAARAELQSVSSTIDERGRRFAATLERPTSVFWRVSSLRDTQLVMMGGVFLLLLIACVNVASLLLGAGQNRATELAVRRALGAGRFRLIRLLLVESLLLSLAGGALALIIARWAVHLFTTTNPGPQLQTQLENIQLDSVVAGYALMIAILTAAGCGIVPALRGSAAAPRTNLHESGSRTASARRWPRAFIAAEVALSLVLLIAAGLVARAFLQMRLADPGFPADRVLGANIELPEARYQSPERRAAFFDELRVRVSKLPGVVAMGLANGAIPPSDWAAIGDLEIDSGAGRATGVQISVTYASPGHFELMGIPVLAGGGFEARHRDDSGATEIPIVISNSLRRHFWGDRDPTGDAFTFTDVRRTRRFRIIGVAGDASGWGLSRADCEKCQWQMYVPLPARRTQTEVLLRLAEGAPPPIAALRAAIAEVDPTVPSDEGLQTAAASLHAFLGRERFRAALFGGFAVLAVTLVAFGLLAVVFHAVKQRTREIGIRMALGARPSQIRKQILLQGLLPTVGGLRSGSVSIFYSPTA